MKRPQRSLVLLVAVLAVALSALSACGRVGKADSAQDHEFTVGVSFYSLQIPLYAQMADAMKAEAKERGVKLEVVSGDFTAETQSTQIASLITRKVDLILASPVNAEALVPAYQRAKDAGIPIISFANKVADQQEDAFVGQPWQKFGAVLVKQAAAAVGEKGKVLVVHGPKGADYEVAFAKGIDEEIGKHPGLTVVAAPYNNNLSISDAVGLVSAALTADPDIKAVIADDDSSALGAVQAFKDRGISTDGVFIGGFGGYPATLDAMRAGDGPSYTISLKPSSWGKLAVATAADWLEGKKPAGHIVESPYQEVTSETLPHLSADQLN